VRVANAARSPLPGEWGKVISVALDDPRAPYLVRFDNGLEFRYRLEELETGGLLPAITPNYADAGPPGAASQPY